MGSSSPYDRQSCFDGPQLHNFAAARDTVQELVCLQRQAAAERNRQQRAVEKEIDLVIRDIAFLRIVDEDGICTPCFLKVIRSYHLGTKGRGVQKIVFSGTHMFSFYLVVRGYPVVFQVSSDHLHAMIMNKMARPRLTIAPQQSTI